MLVLSLFYPMDANPPMGDKNMSAQMGCVHEDKSLRSHG
jgi:hypothetical protein